MEENWCCLAISILRKFSPEQAFKIYKDGKKPYVRLSESDMFAIERYRKAGLQWNQIGELFSIEESTIVRRYWAYKKVKAKVAM